MTRRLAVLAAAAALVLTGGTATASVDPGDGPPPTTVTPAPPILTPAPVYCQYDVNGRKVGVGLPLGVQGRNQRVIVEVTHPYSAQAKRMPRSGSVTFTFPLPLTYAQVKSVTVGSHKCGVA